MLIFFILFILYLSLLFTIVLFVKKSPVIIFNFFWGAWDLLICDFPISFIFFDSSFSFFESSFDFLICSLNESKILSNSLNFKNVNFKFFCPSFSLVSNFKRRLFKRFFNKFSISFFTSSGFEKEFGILFISIDFCKEVFCDWSIFISEFIFYYY